MAEYNRFVSYMYAYENNKKTVNNGFVRVETRDKESSVYVNMKELYGSSMKYRVYMVKRAARGLNGICLGEMEKRQGGGEFCCKITKDNINNSGISLIEIAGIVILGENGRKYATCWDDDSLDVELFALAAASGETLINAQKPEHRFVMGQHDDMEIISDDVITEDAITEEEIPDNAAPKIQQEILESDVPEKDLSEEDEKEEFKPLMAESIALSAADMPRASAFFGEPLMGNHAKENEAMSDISENRHQTIKKRLKRIMDSGIKMYPFEDNEIECCIRLEIQDIGMLPMKYWFYAGNSFVLQSYYAYRHLILAQKSDGSYIFGVPGLGEQKDAFMAGQFGFRCFKAIREKSDEMPSSDFGYWYARLI